MTAPNFLNTEEKSQVESAIAKAEESTAAEIVCAVATESGRYDRAESMLGLLFALLFLGITYSLSPFATDGSSAHWEEAAPPGLVWLALAVVLGFVVGNLLGSHLHGLRRLLVGQQEMEEETLKAASHVFSLRRIANAETRAGVLIYISLFEHRVVILADHGATKALSPQDIENLRDLALESLRKGERCQSLLLPIEAAAERLVKGLPALDEGARNELPDELVIYHPRP